VQQHPSLFCCQEAREHWKGAGQASCCCSSESYVGLVTGRATGLVIVAATCGAVVQLASSCCSSTAMKGQKKANSEPALQPSSSPARTGSNTCRMCCATPAWSPTEFACCCMAIIPCLPSQEVQDILCESFLNLHHAVLNEPTFCTRIGSSTRVI
jgi:hypothetical protein